MCSVFGMLCDYVTPEDIDYLESVFQRSSERGRDSWGLVLNSGLQNFKKEFGAGHDPSPKMNQFPLSEIQGGGSLIGNWRGEPTTEWVLRKTDVNCQPFIHDQWAVTHNGTIANDKELWETLKLEKPTPIDSAVIPACFSKWGFAEGLAKLQGSFAIIASHSFSPNSIFYATNYRPLYICGTVEQNVIAIGSQFSYLVHEDRSKLFHPSPIEVEPYTAGYITFEPGRGFTTHQWSLYPEKKTRKRVLVVCSGGLDSATVAWKHHVEGDDVELFHLQYGCRAEGIEVKCVEKLAEAMGSKVHFIQTDFFKQSATSVLTDPTQVISTAAGGAAGAEFAHEWVPARNTVLLALAAAYAEAHNFDVLALGSNMEEAGAYPDNEPEFIQKWRSLSPYAVKAYHRLDFSDPCSNMVKHEIVELGLEIKVPYELTWSCYSNGPEPCGTCGPCFMRHRAFQMNNAADPLIGRKVVR